VWGLADREYEAGTHDFAWDGFTDEGRRAAPGIYLARTRIGKAEWTQKLVRLR
jgi:hypothetical protein